MNQRVKQREQTRSKIIDAAIESFTQTGFKGTSTRDIANSAGLKQGLVMYHFKSKEELWQATVDRTFSIVKEKVIANTQGLERTELQRTMLRNYVQFAADHPEFIRLMVDIDGHSKENIEWFCKEHLKPVMAVVSQAMELEIDDVNFPHFFYIMAGATSLIFAVSSECKTATGLDPTSPAGIERHTNILESMLLTNL